MIIALRGRGPRFAPAACWTREFSPEIWGGFRTVDIVRAAPTPNMRDRDELRPGRLLDPQPTPEIWSTLRAVDLVRGAQTLTYWIPGNFALAVC